MELAGGDEQQINFELLPAPAVTGAVKSKAADNVEAVMQTGYGYTPFVVASAVTLALGGAAVFFGYHAVKAEHRLKDELNQFPLNDAARKAASQDTRKYALTADIFAGGAVLALASSVFFLVTASPASATQSANWPKLRVGGNQLLLMGQF
jgi:hypothetical protein